LIEGSFLQSRARVFADCKIEGGGVGGGQKTRTAVTKDNRVHCIFVSLELRDSLA